MSAFEKAKWIWIENSNEKNTYGEFFLPYVFHGGHTRFRISCDSDYTLFINGTFVASNQYGDYEHYKIYDDIDVTAYLHTGKNAVALLVWHFGEDLQRHIAADAGVIFEIIQDGKTVVYSDENVLCRKSKAYRNGLQKTVTPQLGYSFLYDANEEDEWKNGDLQDFHPAVCVEKTRAFYPRPIPKLVVKDRKNITVLQAKESYYLIDLGEETVGLLDIEFTSQEKQNVLIAWGEDLQNGHVRRLIDSRDFSVEYIAKKGENKYTNHMLRLGGRYLEIYAQAPISLRYAGVLPQVYPVTEKLFALQDETEQRIYDVCVRTLKLSMMEHYVDTPWREQCLYVMDSRNQMLCGYYAFEDGNRDYVRANLKLISQDNRKDGLLSICYPCGMDLTIPSFSLYYFLAVREYIEYTGDIAFVKEIYPKLLSVLEVFVQNRKDGLVCKFEGAENWNFYEWIPALEGTLFRPEQPMPDLMINALFIIALNNLREIAQKIGETFSYEEILKETKAQAKKVFYNAQKSAFAHTVNGEHYTVLGNACAILAGLATGEEKRAICEKMLSDELLECTLSMKYFKYESLLLTDKETYAEKVLAEIKSDYTKMLNAGATSVWETILGAADFDNAGSLCHGWSAVPIYYYHTLRK